MQPIKNVFDNVATDYDKHRNSLIPCFDDFYKTIVFLMGPPRNNLTVMDIGAGTGLLSHFALNKFPDASFVLVDISGGMLGKAKERFADKANFSYLEADYSKVSFDMDVDIVISSLSVHHLDHDEKALLYKNIYKVLKPGGSFINGDLFLARTDASEAMIQDLWIEKIEASLLATDQKKAAYERMKLDKPDTIENTVRYMEEAGFTDVELFYKYFNFGVIRGIKA